MIALSIVNSKSDEIGDNLLSGRSLNYSFITKGDTRLDEDRMV